LRPVTLTVRLPILGASMYLGAVCIHRHITVALEQRFGKIILR
jgi:hypothetical protein